MVGLLEAVKGISPASVRNRCAVVEKRSTCVDLEPDYFCFRIPDEFVVGYGLDYNDEFRHLPYIGIPDEDDLQAAVGKRH